MHSSPFVVLEISMTICTQDGHCLGGYMSQGIYGVPNVWQLTHGEDRVLLVQSDDDYELKIHDLIILIISNQFASFLCLCYFSPSFLFECILCPKVGPRAGVNSLLIKAFFLPDLSSTLYEFYPKLASNSIAHYFTKLNVAKKCSFIHP
jgi:hypothetical protein